MKFGILFLFLFSFFHGNAQKEGLAIINDPDGYVNIRNDTGKIISRLFNGDVFMCDLENDADIRTTVVFNPEISSLSLEEKKYYSKFIGPENNCDTLSKSCWVEGFISKKKFIWLNDLPRVKSTLTGMRHSMEAKIGNDSLTIDIQRASFDINQHKIKKSAEGERIESIDGMKPYGIDGEIPTWEVSTLSLNIHGKTIPIPVSAYKDIYEPHLKNFYATYDKKGNIYLLLSGSDGAGGYNMVWIIKKGKYLKRYIDTSFD